MIRGSRFPRLLFFAAAIPEFYRRVLESASIRGGAITAARFVRAARAPRCLPVLYETRKLVKCVIMLTGGQQGRASFLPCSPRPGSDGDILARLFESPPPTRSLPFPQSRVIPVAVSAASYSPAGVLLRRCQSLVSARLDSARETTRGEPPVVSLTLRRSVNSRKDRAQPIAAWQRTHPRVLSLPID